MFERVNRLLEQYQGGQIFFTELDKSVKFDEEILFQLTEAVRKKYDGNVRTIASGEIALAMHNFGVTIDFIVPGGLRFDPSKINLEPFGIKGKFVFIDDSYFSGRTYQVVKEEIKRLGGQMLGAYVAYDGSKHKEENIDSLYRYYDHHDILGRKIEK